jgi:hypothetical protein
MSSTATTIIPTDSTTTYEYPKSRRKVVKNGKGEIISDSNNNNNNKRDK